MKRTYKKHTTGRTTVSAHIYIDDDLYPAFSRLTNKTRFINEAIREKMAREKK